MFEELKPCPFCGEKPYAQVVCSNNHVVVRILCGGQNCDVKFKKALDVGTNFGEAIKAMHDVTALWNTREGVQNERNRE